MIFRRSDSGTVRPTPVDAWTTMSQRDDPEHAHEYPDAEESEDCLLPLEHEQEPHAQRFPEGQGEPEADAEEEAGRNGLIESYLLHGETG